MLPVVDLSRTFQMNMPKVFNNENTKLRVCVHSGIPLEDPMTERLVFNQAILVSSNLPTQSSLTIWRKESLVIRSKPAGHSVSAKHASRRSPEVTQ